MPATNSKLQKWLNRVSGDMTEDGPVVRYELWHAIEGEESNRLELWHVAEGITAMMLGEMIQDAADTDSETRLGNPQRYVVFSFRANTGDSNDSQCAFLVRTPQRRYGEDSEPGTEKGINTQVLRHNENMHRLIINQAESSLARMTQEIERERERRQKAEQTLFDTWDKTLEIQRQEQERRIADRNEERKDQMLAMVMSMAPAIAAKVMGHNAPLQLPGSEDPRITAIKSFFGNLDEAEVVKIMENLPASKRLQMIQLYEAFEQKEPEPGEEKPPPESLQ